MPDRPVLVRLLLPFALMIALLVSVCGGVVWWAGQRTVQLEQVRDLNRMAALVRQWLGPATPPISPEQISRLTQASEVVGTRITLIDGSGKVIFDTHADARDMDNHNQRAEVAEARAGRVGSAVRHSGTMHEPNVYVAQLLDPKQPNGIVLRLSFPRSMWAQLSTPTWVIVAAGVTGALGVMLALAWLLQRQWIGPVQRLSDAAAKMANGEWGTRVDARGAGELRAFSGKLNVLAGQAQKQLADLDAQRSDLRALVDALPDPVMLADSMRRIAIINAPAARLLQFSAAGAIGKNIVGVVNDEAILALLESLKPQPGQMEQREIRLVRGGQHVTYHAVAKRMAAGGVLLVLRNVSTMAAAVQMKTDFVANASHELRTPIAAIKAAFETLQEVHTQDPEQTGRCISIIAGHIQRLEDMLADLLDLSRVESADLKPQVGPIPPHEVFATLRQTLGPLARQKGVQLSLGERDEPIEFESDKRLLDLILKNLVENSIKFTPAGGTVSVSVRAESQPRNAVSITVSDTGIGIPTEHLERVFERFYQVDAARSGSSGRGTGLGLAIVKHAINALGGEVRLASTVGKGTTVTCVFPQGHRAPEPRQRSQVVSST
jgi:two-component system phosphate regulon sensor histidine kinase PhoR